MAYGLAKEALVPKGSEGSWLATRDQIIRALRSLGIRLEKSLDASRLVTRSNAQKSN